MGIPGLKAFWPFSFEGAVVACSPLSQHQRSEQARGN